MMTKKADSGMSFWSIAGIVAAVVLVIVVVGLYFFGGNPIKFFSWLGFDGNKTEEIEGIEIFRYDITKEKLQYYDGTTFSDFNPSESLKLGNKRIDADTLLEDIEKWYFHSREGEIIPIQNGKVYPINEFYALIKEGTSGNGLPQNDIDYLVRESINEMWCAPLASSIPIKGSDGISKYNKDFIFSLENEFDENSNDKNYIYLNGEKTKAYIVFKVINIDDEKSTLGTTIGNLIKRSDVCRYDFNLYEPRQQVNSAFGGNENYFDMLNGALIEKSRIILKDSEAAKSIEEQESSRNKEELNIENVKINKYEFDPEEIKIRLEDKRSGKTITSAGAFILGADNKFYFSYKINTQKEKIEISKAELLNIYNGAKEWRDSVFTKPIPITIFPVSPEVNPESPINVCPQFKDNKYIVIDLAKRGDSCPGIQPEIENYDSSDCSLTSIKGRFFDSGIKDLKESYSDILDHNKLISIEIEFSAQCGNIPKAIEIKTIDDSGKEIKTIYNYLEWKSSLLLPLDIQDSGLYKVKVYCPSASSVKGCKNTIKEGDKWVWIRYFKIKKSESPAEPIYSQLFSLERNYLKGDTDRNYFLAKDINENYIKTDFFILEDKIYAGTKFYGWIRELGTGDRQIDLIDTEKNNINNLFKEQLKDERNYFAMLENAKIEGKSLNIENIAAAT